MTPAHARDAYGVVMADGAVDLGGDAGAPDGAPGRAGPPGAFDFGAARDAHERRWPSDLQDSFVALLMALPLPYRRVRPPRALPAGHRARPSASR